MTQIDKVLAFNRKFVAAKGYEKHVTDKFPKKNLAVLSCNPVTLGFADAEACAAIALRLL